MIFMYRYNIQIFNIDYFIWKTLLYIQDKIFTAGSFFFRKYAGTKILWTLIQLDLPIISKHMYLIRLGCHSYYICIKWDPTTSILTLIRIRDIASRQGHFFKSDNSG